MVKVVAEVVILIENFIVLIEPKKIHNNIIDIEKGGPYQRLTRIIGKN
jgi:hypothetical protein